MGGMDTEEIIEGIREYWDKRSFDFDKDHDTEDIDAWKGALAELLGDDHAKNVLDLGAGSGFLANMTAQLGFPSVAMDISTGMMANGVRHAERSHASTFFIEGNALETKVMADSIDFIVNARLIWTIVEKDRMVAEWLRVLRPGGKLFCFNRMDEKEGLGSRKPRQGFRYQDSRIDAALDTAEDSRESLIDLLTRNGYQDVEIVHLPGLTRSGYDYQDWYVLVGTKPYPQRRIEEIGLSRFWDDAATRYEAGHALDDIPVWQNVLRGFIGSNRDAEIVDVATGTGMIANMLAADGYTDVVGVDISEQMMRIAIDHAREQDRSIPFVYGNAMDLPFSDDTADVVINSRLLWTLSEPEEALREWRRVLRDGGKVIAINEFEPEGIRCPSMDSYTENTDVRDYPFSNIDIDMLLKAFADAGFRNVEYRSMPGCHMANSGRENWAAVIGIK